MKKLITKQADSMVRTVIPILSVVFYLGCFLLFSTLIRYVALYARGELTDTIIVLVICLSSLVIAMLLLGIVLYGAYREFIITNKKED